MGCHHIFNFLHLIYSHIDTLNETSVANCTLHSKGYYVYNELKKFFSKQFEPLDFENHTRFYNSIIHYITNCKNMGTNITTLLTPYAYFVSLLL